MGCKVFKITSEGLIDPNIAPPECGDEVAEPLVSHFVCHDSGYEDFIYEISILFIIQKECFSVTKFIIFE